MSTVVNNAPAVPDTPVPVLATPDPVQTTEQFVAFISTALTFGLVWFHFNLDPAVKAGLLTAVGGLYSAFTLWHAKGVRAARAIGRGLAAGGNTISVK